MFYTPEILNCTKFALVGSAPAVALSLADAKKWLKLEADITEDDDLITSLIAAATNNCQQYSWRQFITSSYVTKFRNWPSQAIIWRNPVTAITHIKYYDENNEIQTLDPSHYSVTLQEPCTIEFKHKPGTYDKLDAIEITFVAGYANAAALPTEFATAIKIMVAELYNNRQNTIIGQAVNQVPNGSAYLLDLNDCKAII